VVPVSYSFSSVSILFPLHLHQNVLHRYVVYCVVIIYMQCTAPQVVKCFFFFVHLLCFNTFLHSGASFPLNDVILNSGKFECIHCKLHILYTCPWSAIFCLAVSASWSASIWYLEYCD